MNIQACQGPTTLASIAEFKKAYCQQGEGYREVCNRVAYALADGPDHYHTIRGVMQKMGFLFGGRIMSKMGSTKRTTPYNCFVSGKIEDSFVDDEGSIMQRAHEAAATMRMGGGIGYDFSTLRPRGSHIAGVNSNSTGPLSFMKIFNEIGICTSSSGHRRGAQMGIMRIDHPDIEEFILAKNNEDQLRGFNLSVAVTDEFMKAVIDNTMFALSFNGHSYREVEARTLWNTLMRSTWDWAEPGIIFIDRVNKENNLYYCEQISATNPCAEQPLPPFGACLLGSVNVTSYLRDDAGGSTRQKWWIDTEAIRRDLYPTVRALDNVVDRALYPLPQQAHEAVMKRRMGIGVTGVANAIETCGAPYGSDGFVHALEGVLSVIRDTAYTASSHLAREKGSFPAFDRESYLDATFISRLPSDVKDLIAKQGIRNSHLTSIAPTGTISFCADNISSGIEPVFAYEQERLVRTGEEVNKVLVKDYAYDRFGTQGKTIAEVSIEDHLAVLCSAQKFVDSGISKTCNVGEEVTWEEFKCVYLNAYAGGAKMCATYRTNGKRGGVLKDANSDCKSGQCSI